jgi:hypothetical protein
MLLPAASPAKSMWRMRSLLLPLCACTSSEVRSPDRVASIEQLSILPADSLVDGISDVVAAHDGTFWAIVVKGDRLVVHYASDGGVLRRIGPRGQGPSDLSLPWNFLASPRDTVVQVWDRALSSIKEITSGGAVTPVWTHSNGVHHVATARLP